MTAGILDHVGSTDTIREGWLSRWSRSLRTRAYRVLSDQTLVRRAREHDHTAFAALVARYRDRLRALALDTLEREDDKALCRMVLAAFGDIDSFATRCSPGTWLYLHGLRAAFESLTVTARLRPSS